MKIFLIRHGESYSNTQGRCMSTTDLELTTKGIEQSKRAGLYLQEDISEADIFVFCSTLKRTYQTAESFFSVLPYEKIEIQPIEELKEMDLGELEGLTWEERELLYPEIKIDTGLSYVDAPMGENFQIVKKRCQQFIEKTLVKINNSATVLIFSHGITLRVLTNVLLDRQDQDVNKLNWMENTAITEIDYEVGSRNGCVCRLNDFSHLKELGTRDYCKWGLFSQEEY